MNVKKSEIKKVRLFLQDKEIPCGLTELNFCDNVKTSNIRQDKNGSILWDIDVTIPFTLPRHISYKQARFMLFGNNYQQAKTHKKGRINKKWAKRYGYILENKEGH